MVIVDDMIDTAGTLCEAARELRKKGAKRVFAFATHGSRAEREGSRRGERVLEGIRWYLG